MTLQQQLAWNKKNLEYKAQQKLITQNKKDNDFDFDDETKQNLEGVKKSDYMKKRTNVVERHGLLDDVDEESEGQGSLKKSSTVNESLFDQIA